MGIRQKLRYNVSSLQKNNSTGSQDFSFYNAYFASDIGFLIPKVWKCVEN